ncbi:paraquat-inducible membrane protein A, partial [Thioclava sp. BHET1]
AEAETCARCGALLTSRTPRSLSRVWAWWLAGLVVYIPANIYPMLITRTLTYSGDNTIVGGALDLWNDGDYIVAAVVLLASVCIPIGKFIAIAYLALTLGTSNGLRRHRQHRLYAVVEFIGRWSMIDVFVVAIVASLVQFGEAATIRPGIAAISFALSVSFTMLSAQSFDSRLIWDDD